MTAQQPPQDGFMDRARWVWAEGLRRHVVVEKDRRVLDLPLTVVLVAMVLAPWLVVIGVVIAVLLSYGMRVERRDDEPGSADDAADWNPAPEEVPEPTTAADTGDGDTTPSGTGQ